MRFRQRCAKLRAMPATDTAAATSRSPFADPAPATEPSSSPRSAPVVTFEIPGPVPAGAIVSTPSRLPFAAIESLSNTDKARRIAAQYRGF